MFGHQDDKKDDDESSQHDTIVAPDAQTAEAPDTGAADHTEQTDDIPAAHIDSDAGGAGDGQADNSGQTDDDASEDDGSWQHPGAPLTDGEDKPDEDDKTPAPIKDIIGGANAGPSFKPLSHDDGDRPVDNTPHELIDIKQKALTDLMPLVDKLDQTPEDKFRTTMMMIQASDDQGLVKTAYEAAHAIGDEKVRAQALLDIVNEINYFTQHPEN